jgi:hypothetical protein
MEGWIWGGRAIDHRGGSIGIDHGAARPTEREQDCGVGLGRRGGGKQSQE